MVRVGSCDVYLESFDLYFTTHEYTASSRVSSVVVPPRSSRSRDARVRSTKPRVNRNESVLTHEFVE